MQKLVWAACVQSRAVCPQTFAWLGRMQKRRWGRERIGDDDGREERRWEKKRGEWREQEEKKKEDGERECVCVAN
ncbi:hypothetical protein Dda_7990 [Drechslerella dactyloides]|uniref:Uncharacterized protein n=1 Tax=Drechslerella dactyloides TaxID=74499 RepID=A0AAD6IRA5_DREDA|nr:hypothetical protein Dda_7990 [Drechslerella dactyloides]